MIEVENLTKRYGDKVAVDGLTFTVQPGMVTGFLGPNGAGKSTTLLMTEMAQTATNLIVIGRGRLIAESTVEQFIATTTAASVMVRSPEAGRLYGLLDRPGVRVAAEGPDLLRVNGITAEEIGTIAYQAHVPVFDLRAERASLEEAFMQATHDGVEYQAIGLENL